ncbi:MAG: hypothetical protein ACLFWL_15585 [Candidatus Brocadiia bacterium]
MSYRRSRRNRRQKGSGVKVVVFLGVIAAILVAAFFLTRSPSEPAAPAEAARDDEREEPRVAAVPAEAESLSDEELERLREGTDEAKPAEPEQENDEGLEYSTTWYGNTWPGGPKWVQTSISYLSALPDGRILTSSPWDEAHREDTVYGPDGDLLGGVRGQHSRVIGGDSRYLYIALQSSEFEGEKWRPIGRYHADDFQSRPQPRWAPYEQDFPRPAPFDGGKGGDGNVLPVYREDDVVEHEEDDGWRAPQQLRGIASDGETLVIAEDGTHKVHVFDVESMERVRQFDLRYPGPVALDGQGNIWAIRRPEVSEGRKPNAQEEGEYRIIEFSPEGEPTGREVPDVGSPSDLTIGGPDGRMYVADIAHERMNLQIYDISPGEEPVHAGEFGEPGGVFAGPVPGRMGTHRFDTLCGVGIDEEGHISIATRGKYAGSFIRRFTPDGEEMMWQVYSSQFMNATTFDRAYDGTVVYGGRGGSNRSLLHYDRTDRLDTWFAVTSDPYRFPHDRRGRHSTHLMRFPNDKPYLVTAIRAGREGTLILRPESNSEIFIPSVFLASGHQSSGNYPPDHPKANGNWARLMWRDANGDGRMGEDEYLVVESTQNTVQHFVDNLGGIWVHRYGFKRQRSEKQGFLHFPLQGFDEHDNPIWDFSISEGEFIATPDDFPESRYATEHGKAPVEHFYYDARKDRMFISGYLEGYEGRTGGSVGAHLVRYDHFTDPDRREKVSVIDLPIEKGRHFMKSFAVTGDLLFAGLGKQRDDEFIHIYNTRTGEDLGAMYVGEKLYGESSWLDLDWAMDAFIRENGEIIVTVENNWKNLQIVFRIPPGQEILEGLELPASGWEEKKPTPVEDIDPGLLED